MSRRDEPNASHYSARYAERKRTRERARDAASKPSPCVKCPAEQAYGSIFCLEHAKKYKAMIKANASADKCIEFCRRTYWP